MKLYKYLLIVLTTVAFISACQKELFFDKDGFARGTLKADAATGECLPSVVNGIFKVDSILNNTNFIDVQVNLTSTGTYEIVSDTLNGYSFKGTGTLGAVGLNTVRLYATGKPLLSGTNIFKIKFDNSNCDIAVIVLDASTGAAVYNLGGAPGDCSGAIINGTYTAGTILGVGNSVTFTIDVISTGTYVLGAASVNGMLFTATGFFQNTGAQTVTLNATGLPVTDGNFNLTATNGTSSCTFSVTVLPVGVAIFSLDIAAGACSGATYAGAYTAGVPLASGNTAVVNVSVTALGDYTLSTDLVNGITFSAAGTFTNLGPQAVTLVGTGTPLAGGIFNFNLTTGVSSCIFSVTMSGTPPPNEEYILFTPNSNFSQRVVGGAVTDTFYRRVDVNTININANNYLIYQGLNNGIAVDSSYFRKDAGKYYELQNMRALGFDNATQADILLLDSNLAVNDSWISDLGSNTMGGLPVTAKATSTIIAKAAIVVIAGNTYNNVFKVKYLFSFNSGTGDTNFQENEIWYAKGKGIIYLKVSNVPPTSSSELETTRIQVL